jgi:transposase
MAYEEVSRVEIIELLRRWQAGGSYRGLSRATGLSRSTVQKYIRVAEECGVRRGGPPPTEAQIMALVKLHVAGPRKVATPAQDVLSPRADQVQRWLEVEHLQLTRVQELLGQKGCTVSYMSLRRFVIRRGWWRLGQDRATVRMEETKPGEVAEVDFGRLGLIWDPESSRRRVVWALVVVLVYSRHCFVWPLFQQRLEDVIEGLEAAWALFQGIPRILVPDNMPAAVAGPDPLYPRLTRGFLEYSQHRGFFVDPARVRHPRDKPHVERGVPYVRGRLFKGGTFLGLEDMRDQARRWCLEVAGQRIHGTTQRMPLVVFREEEQAHLLPWDGEPYDVADWRTATVHPDHHIAYRYAIYSAPSTNCPPGSKVEVRGDSKLVRIYHRGMLVKVHPRQPRGGRSTDPNDYPAELTPYTLRNPDRLKRQAAELGPAVGAFADRLLSGSLPWAKLRQGHKLLRLGERYTSERLDAACQRALTVDLIDVRRLERILVEALETEAMPTEAKASPLPGRFARPGSAFTHRNGHAALVQREDSQEGRTS